jgi:hypothetical protein
VATEIYWPLGSHSLQHRWRSTLTRSRYNTDYEVNAIGRPFPSPYHPTGPCITGIIDNRSGHDNPLDGYVIQEGAIPKALAPFMQAMLELLPQSPQSSNEGLVDRFKANLARVGSFFLGPYLRQGSVGRTQVYLVMSHDCKLSRPQLLAGNSDTS